MYSVKASFFITACFAIGVFSKALLAQESIHHGNKVVPKETLIEQLTPKPLYKTRGIQFGQPAQDVPKTKPSVSLSVNFAHDSYELLPEALDQLAPLGQALKSDQLSKYAFQIDGHTDASGTEAYNQSLSEKRALSVGNYLYESFGIDPKRLSLQGKGESQLFDTANPNSGKNRRVQISTVVE